MAVRVSRPLTLIAALPDALCAQFSRHAVFDKLLTVLNADDVSCIQFVPRSYVRITLKSFDVRQAVLQSGITIESFRLAIFEADPVTVEVSLEHLPIEVSDEDLRVALGPFGTIHGVCLQKHAGSDVLTGTRVLTMSLTSDIPVNLRVLRYPCRVLYRGQPRPCSICRSADHRASSCSLRGKCRRCLQPGHFARDCESVLPGSDSSFVPDENASVDDVASVADDVADDASAVDDDASAVDDDAVDDDISAVDDASVDDASDDVSAVADGAQSESEEFVSGDEEVVGAVSTPAPPVEEPVAAAPARAVPDPPSVPVDVLPDSIASRVKSKVTRVSTSQFRWIARFSKEFFETVVKSGHSTDSHVISETYHTSDHRLFSMYGVLDFDKNTFRVLKDVLTFEDLHLRSYNSGFFPSRTKFPGPRAISGQSLSPDIAPSKFPGCN